MKPTEQRMFEDWVAFIPDSYYPAGFPRVDWEGLPPEIKSAWRQLSEQLVKYA